MLLSTRRQATIGVCVAAGVLMCAAPPGVAAEPDQQAKTFAPSAGKAAIYVYRMKSGNILRVPVTIDGRHIGDIGKGSYFWLEVEPGEHEVWVGFDHGAGPHAKVKLIQVNAQIGECYFVRVNMTYARDKHEAVDSKTGKAELLACCTLVAAEQSESSVFR